MSDMAIFRQLPCPRYNRRQMSLFDSFNFLDRGWDVRVLENQSLRSVFLWLLVSLFVLGADAALAMYQFFHLHRFNWSDLALLALLGINSCRLARIVYRRLGA